MSCALFVYMLRGHPIHLCATLLEKYIHSLAHLVIEIDSAFNHFDCEALNKEILKLWKAPNESVEQFHKRFCNLAYWFPEDGIYWEFLDGRFEYLLYISENPQFLKSLESCSYSNGGTVQSRAGIVAVTSDYPPSPHQTATTTEWCGRSCTHICWTTTSSHPTCSLYLCIFGLQAYWLSRGSIPSTSVPTFYWSSILYCLCSSILDSTLVVKEDQAIDRVGVVHPTCAIIHDECVRESK